MPATTTTTTTTTTTESEPTEHVELSEKEKEDLNKALRILHTVNNNQIPLVASGLPNNLFGKQKAPFSFVHDLSTLQESLDEVAVVLCASRVVPAALAARLRVLADDVVTLNKSVQQDFCMVDASHAQQLVCVRNAAQELDTEVTARLAHFGCNGDAKTDAGAAGGKPRKWLVAKEALFPRNQDNIPILIVGMYKLGQNVLDCERKLREYTTATIPVADPATHHLRLVSFAEGGTAHGGAGAVPVSEPPKRRSPALGLGRKLIKSMMIAPHHDAEASGRLPQVPVQITLEYNGITCSPEVPAHAFDSFDEFVAWLCDKALVPCEKTGRLAVEMRVPATALTQGAAGRGPLQDTWVPVSNFDVLRPGLHMRLCDPTSKVVNLAACERKPASPHEGASSPHAGSPHAGSSPSSNGTNSPSTSGASKEPIAKCPGDYVPLISVIEPNREHRPPEKVVPTQGKRIIVVSKRCLTFPYGDKKQPPIKTYVSECFLVKSFASTPVELTIKPSVPKCSRYCIAFDPSEVTLKPHGSQTVTAKIAISCTATIQFDVPVVAKTTGANGPETQVCALAINTTSAKTTHIDLAEIFVKPEAIGRGASGIVYRGFWNGQDAAVKVMINQGFSKEEEEEFKREVSTLELIRSPYAVRFLGASYIPGRLAVVTEFMPFGSVLSAVKTKHFPFILKLKCLLDCAKGMQFLHNSRIMHRDLKPDNLLMCSMNPSEPVCCKITDFGTTRAIGATQDNTMTAGVGTPVYMAPEVLTDSHYTFSCDVYSYSLIIWFFVTQKEPFQDSSFESLYALGDYVGAGNRPPIPPDAPPALTTLMTRCWEQVPSERPNFNDIAKFMETMLNDAMQSYAAKHKMAATAHGTGDRHKRPVSLAAPISQEALAASSITTTTGSMLHPKHSDSIPSQGPLSTESHCSAHPSSGSKPASATASPLASPAFNHRSLLSTAPVTSSSQTASKQQQPPQSSPPESLPACVLLPYAGSAALPTAGGMPMMTGSGTSSPLLASGTPVLSLSPSPSLSPHPSPLLGARAAPENPSSALPHQM